MYQNYNTKDAGHQKWLKKTATMSIDNNRTWSVVRTDKDNQLEEMVFMVQGIIAKKDLPLVVDTLSKDNYIFVHQHVRLTGLGCKAFKDAADSILEEQPVFERQFPEGAFEKWTAANTDYCVGIDISNRYLETRKAYPQEEAMFEKGVDAKGILAAACTRRNLIHTEDNKVRFFTSSLGNEGGRKFEAAESQIFRVGVL